MGYHILSSIQSRQNLIAQKRNSSILSLFISLLVTTSIIVALYYITLTTRVIKDESVVTYAPLKGLGHTTTSMELMNKINNIPVHPSTSMARVISSRIPSPAELEKPTPLMEVIAIDELNVNDFGHGWGEDTSEPAVEAIPAKNEIPLLGEAMEAERIVYVIDSSTAMGGEKFKILKKELSKSITSLPDNVEYQVICFAGPAWIAGDEVIASEDGSSYQIKSGENQYGWLTFGDDNEYRPTNAANVQTAHWRQSNATTKEQTLQNIKDFSLFEGAIWNHPLEMALNMSPKPNAIYFITNGAVTPQNQDIALEMANRAKVENIQINAIALSSTDNVKELTDLNEPLGWSYKVLEQTTSVPPAHSE